MLKSFLTGMEGLWLVEPVGNQPPEESLGLGNAGQQSFLFCKFISSLRRAQAEHSSVQSPRKQHHPWISKLESKREFS